MREILFRGRQTDKDKWVYGVPVKATSKDESEILIIESVFACDEYLCRGCEFTPVIPSTVGQYTDLTDKNGKKIFEGDILRTGTRMGYILFEKGCFRFRWKNFDKYRGDFFKTCIITEYGSFRGLEVIGNIHDNPELLKGGAERWLVNGMKNM